MKDYVEIKTIAKEVIDFMSEKDLTILEARSVLEEAEKSMMSDTKLKATE